MTKTTQKTAKIVALGHALVLGARGEAGGAPSKDSIWGIAQVGNTLVSFSGRRNAETFRFMTHKQVELEALKQKFADKLAGKNIWYTYQDKTASAEQLVVDLAAKVNKGYYKAVAARKLNNTRKTQAERKSAE